MRNVFRVAAAALLACTAACASSGAPAAAKHTTVDDHPLAGLVAQHILVTPVFALTVAPELGWNGELGRRRAVLARLDSIIADTLDDRGVRHWVFPPELERSYHANPTYASDPYALGFEPLRPASFIAGSRLPEPLASQLRTMSALSDGRYILAPVELRFEHVGGAGDTGRAVLRLALLDSRLSEARWIGEVRSDTASRFSAALLGSLASHFADLIVAP